MVLSLPYMSLLPVPQIGDGKFQGAESPMPLSGNRGWGSPVHTPANRGWDGDDPRDSGKSGMGMGMIPVIPCLFFRAAIASGLVTVILRTFSAPLPQRVVLNAQAFARRMRL